MMFIHWCLSYSDFGVQESFKDNESSSAADSLSDAQAQSVKKSKDNERARPTSENLFIFLTKTSLINDNQYWGRQGLYVQCRSWICYGLTAMMKR